MARRPSTWGSISRSAAPSTIRSPGTRFPAALEKGLEPRQLGVVYRDHDLAAFCDGDGVLGAEAPQQPGAGDTQLRLQGPGRVVQARVDHPAVVAALMGADGVLPFDDDDHRGRVRLHQSAGHCQSDDASADDGQASHVPSLGLLQRVFQARSRRGYSCSW